MQHAFSIPHRSLAGDRLVDILRLIRTPGVGPVTFFNLMARYKTAREALDALPILAARGGRKQPLVASPVGEAEKEIEAAEKFGAKFILYGSPEYPKLLHTLTDAPPIITMLGHTHLWQRDMVALVGARNASANGCQFAGRLAKELGTAGLVTVSGLARGIDTFVHKGSLERGTIAVIAGGIDNIYPPENAALFAQIRESGAIISEQPFGAIPFAGAFPGRNRIIAGMSLATVVVEAAPKSGSLITARFAMENNREVLAVPGSPLDPRSKGCNQLIKDGASMVESTSDILQAIAPVRHQLAENTSLPYAAEEKMDTPTDAELSQIRAQVIEKLGLTPVSVDELIEQCDTSAAAILTILLELELAGRLKRSAGNKVYLLNKEMEEVA